MVTVSLEPVADTSIYSENTNSNGAGDALFVGVTRAGSIRRALLRFDVAGNLPAGATVSGVAMEFFIDRSAGGALTVDAHRLSRPFGEGSSVGRGAGAPRTPGDATWRDSMWPQAQWSTRGGDFVAGASGSASLGGSRLGFRNVPGMAADVQAWLDQPATNFGWLLKDRFETAAGNAAALISRDSTSVPFRPALVVTYVLPNPARAVIVGVGCAGTAGGLRFSLAPVGGGLPSLGNSGFALGFSDGPAGASVQLYATLSLAPSRLPIGPGCYLYLDPIELLSSVPSGGGVLASSALDAAGQGSLPIAVPATPSLMGFRIALQGLAPDASVPVGVRLTNALDLTLGF